MAKEIDLDDVSITPDVFAAWSQLVGQLAVALAQLKSLGRDIDIANIPDERARLEDNGALTIYVSIPDVLEVTMSVPIDQWVWRDPNKRH